MTASAVVGAVLRDDDRILLGLRAPDRSWFPNCWDILGGRIEAGETPDEALVRELSEELGITATAFRPIAERKIESGDRTVALTIYCVDAWTGTPRLVNDEHADIRWFTRDKLLQLTPLASLEYRTLFDRLAVT